MDELFQQLEIRIRTMTERCEQLERDNAILMREKEAWSAKNKAAISQIENMIFRLKLVESTS